MIFELLGGITGLAGTAIEGFIKMKERRAAEEYALTMRKMDIEEAAEEHERTLEIKRLDAEKHKNMLEAEAEARQIQGAITEFTRSHESDREAYGGGWVDSLRGSTRPILTYLLIISNILFYFFPDSSDTGVFISNSLSYLGTLAVTWWFGGRAVQKSFK